MVANRRDALAQVAERRAANQSTGVVLDPHPLLAAHENKIDYERLEGLAGRSLTHPDQLDRETVVELSKFSALLERTEIASHHPLDGKVCITSFFEASTRTRLSFESAILRLDGKVLSVPDGKVTGVAKGESLADIGEMFNSYGDLVVMRHPETDAVERIQQNLVRPLINAGNGTGEHPTQALLDWYCLMKWRPAISTGRMEEKERLHVGIVGTPGSMRAVKSFLRMALVFPDAVRRITVVSESDDPISEDLRPAVEASEIPMDCIGDLRDVLADLDVVYINSIALLEGSYELLDQRFALSKDSPLKRGAAILHPLARRDELAGDLDDTPHNLYFAQAAGAVYLRQALLISILDRLKALPTSVLYLTS